MEKVKKGLKFVLIFAILYIAYGFLRLFLDDEIIRPLFREWLDHDYGSGTPRLCFLAPIAYMVMYLVALTIYKLVYKDKAVYLMSIAVIILGYLTNIFGIIGCTCILWA